MATVKLILKKEKLNDQGLAPLYIRIIDNRRSKFISLQKYIRLEDWNETSCLVKKSYKNSNQLNAYLAQKVAETRKLLLGWENKSKEINPTIIKNTLKGTSPTTDFFTYADQYVLSMEKAGKIGTHKRAKAVVAKLRAFWGSNSRSFEEITFSLLKQYEHHLLADLGNQLSTVGANFKLLRTIYNNAIKEDLASADMNPFNKYRIKSTSVQREYLIEEEIKQIEEIALNPASMLYHHRNMFVFAIYAGGLRVSDVLQLKWKNITDGRISLKVQKTANPLNFKLPNAARNILMLYDGVDRKPEEYIFPILKSHIDKSDPRKLLNAISGATAYTNKDLKKIAQLAGINKRISFHTSRHTFATWALKKGISIEYVSKLLGHAAIKETQIYAKIMNVELDKAIDRFND